MKTNLRATLISIALLVGIVVNAQDQKVTAGVKAGLNISNLSGDIRSNDAKVGFNVGVTLDYAFSDNLFLLSGLEFTTKGTKLSTYIEVDEFTGNGTATLNPMYLQIPIHIGYKLNIAENTKLVFRAGPYLAYGVGGKITAKADGIKESENVFQTGGLKNFDFGLGIGTGVEFGKIGVNLGYDFGIINVWDIPGVKVRNGNFNVGVGYKF